MKVLVFSIGADRYGLRLRAIVRVLPVVELKQLPLAPGYVAGLMDLHGAPVPVIDLSRLAGITPEQVWFDTRIILVDYPADDGAPRQLGLLAEHVIGIETFDDAALADSGVDGRALPRPGGAGRGRHAAAGRTGPAAGARRARAAVPAGRGGAMSARELLQRATGLDLSQQAVERAVRERMAQMRRGRYRAIPAAHGAGRTGGADRTGGGARVVDVPRPRRLCRRHRLRPAPPGRAPERVVRILSIPCAGGEEPYSMAMALADAGVAPASFRIEGVDLSNVALERAAAGRYTRNAFRGGDLAFQQRHFSRHGDEYQISDALRAQVSFSQGNLLAFDSAAGAGRYDVVFCRNLLIYFDEATTAAAIAVLRALLADDGMLLAGYAEVPAFCRNGFAPLRVPGAFALQKEQAGAAPQAAGRAARRRRRARKPCRARAPRRRASKAPPKAAQPAPAADAGDDLLAQARRLADQGDYPARRRRLPRAAGRRAGFGRRLFHPRHGQRVRAQAGRRRRLLAPLRLPAAGPLRGAVPPGAAGRTDRRRAAGGRVPPARRARLRPPPG